MRGNAEMEWMQASFTVAELITTTRVNAEPTSSSLHLEFYNRPAELYLIPGPQPDAARVPVHRPA